MKKALVTVFVLFLTLVLCISASAGFLDKLCPNGEYPDDIGAYYYGMTGYNPETPDIKPHQFFFVYVVEGTSEERMNEIRGYLDPTDTIEFRFCKRSNKFYTELSKKIGSEFKSSFGEITSIVIGISQDNTFLIMYVTDNADKIQAEVDAAYPEYKGEIKVYYYDVTTGIDEMGYQMVYENTGSISNPSNSNVLIWIIAVSAIMILGLSAVVVVKLSKKRVLATSYGNEIEEGGNTKGHVEEAISIGQEPSDKVYEEIIKKSK